MKWTAPVQINYLNLNNKRTSGTKEALVNGIMNCLPNKRTFEIVQEHRESLEIRANQLSSNVEVDHDKEDKDIRMQAAAFLLKKRMTGVSLNQPREVLPKKMRMTPRRQKKMHIQHQHYLLPKKLSENTVHKYTDISASSWGGNGVEEGVDQAGWKMEGDDNSVSIDVVSNIVRTRVGILLTPPPSTKEPEKIICLQAQKYFKKTQEINKMFMLVAWKAADQK